MRRHPRTRKTLKWTAVLGLCLLLAAWAFSMSAWLYYVGDSFLIGLASGRIDVQYTSGDLTWGAERLSTTTSDAAYLIRPDLEYFVRDVTGKGATGWAAGRFRDRRPFEEMLGCALPAFENRTYPEWSYPGSPTKGPTTRYGAVVPLWVIFTLGFVPTFWLFWRDRPSPPGHCRTCRYNFRGSCAHRCPECGTPVPEWLAANPPPIRKKRVRTRRNKPLRIALGIAIVGLVGLYAASTVWLLGCHSKHYMITVGFGAIRAYSILDVDPNDHSRHQGFLKPGWSFLRIPRAPRIIQWPTFEHHLTYGAQHRYLVVPLWIPLLPLLLLAALLIYRDRTRRIPGFCHKCGYNLQGNTTGRCPECGHATPEVAP